MAQRATDDKQQSRDVTDGIWRHDTPEPTALLRCVVKAKNEQELNSNTEHDELIEKMNGVTNPQARAIIDRTIDYDFEKSNNPRAQSKAVRALVTPKQLEYAWNEYEQKACEYTTWWLFGQSGEDTAPAAFEQLRDQLLKNEGLDDNVGCRVLEQYIDNFDAPLWDFAYYFIETDATETLKRYSDWFMEERGERLATLGVRAGLDANKADFEPDADVVDRVACELQEHPLSVSGPRDWWVLEPLLQYGYEIDDRISGIQEIGYSSVKKILKPIMNQGLADSLEYLIETEVSTQIDNLTHEHIQGWLLGAANNNAVSCLNVYYDQFGALDEEAGEILLAAYEHGSDEFLKRMFEKEDTDLLVILGADQLGAAKYVHHMINNIDLDPQEVAFALYRGALRVDTPRKYLTYLADTLELDPNLYITDLYVDILDLEDENNNGIDVEPYKEWAQNNVDDATLSGLRL